MTRAEALAIYRAKTGKKTYNSVIALKTIPVNTLAECISKVTNKTYSLRVLWHMKDLADYKEAIVDMIAQGCFTHYYAEEFEKMHCMVVACDEVGFNVTVCKDEDDAYNAIDTWLSFNWDDKMFEGEEYEFIRILHNC